MKLGGRLAAFQAAQLRVVKPDYIKRESLRLATDDACNGNYHAMCVNMPGRMHCVGADPKCESIHRMSKSAVREKEMPRAE